MSDSHHCRLYTARYLLSTARNIIENGALLVDDARITSVAPHDELKHQHPHVPVTDYGESVITPGFVNTHTHTELTAMRGFLDNAEHDFFLWLRRLTRARQDLMTAEDLYTSSAFGAVEAIRSGVTCIGDASDSAATTMRALRDTGLRAIIYQELFGIDERIADAQLAKLKDKINLLRELESSPVQIGISPHAPYTVSGKLIELASRYAIDERLPVMMHAAESAAELAFMMHGTGAFAEGLRARGIAWTPPQKSTIRYLHERGLLEAKPLLAHCITLDNADLDLIAEHDAAIAHCPKSNLKLGHGRAPLTAMIERKIRTGLGSDSVASNNTGDLLEESRFALLLARLKRETDEGGMFAVSTADALELATHGGARALGLENEIGTLEVDKRADFAVISLGGAHQQPIYDLPAALIASSSGRDCVATVINGREVFKNGKVTTIDEDDLQRRVTKLANKLITQTRIT